MSVDLVSANVSTSTLHREVIKLQTPQETKVHEAVFVAFEHSLTPYKPEPITLHQLEEIRERSSIDKFLARSIAANGIGNFSNRPDIHKGFLKTKYDLSEGSSSDQASSGRCWIFSTNNLMRLPYVKEKGKKDFHFSSNYPAFWDKLERANYVFEKMIEYKDLGYEDPTLVSMLENLYRDGGEWELIVNVVEKYGIVPNYAMPETNFSGSSEGYMKILGKRVKEIAGVLHKKAKELPKEELQEIKQEALTEIYRFLVYYLGTPPKKFFLKESDDKIIEITPLDYLQKLQINLKSKVHLTCLPYIASGNKYIVKDVGNMVGGDDLRTLNVSLSDIKETIRKSIKDGAAVEISCEMASHDRNKNLLSLDNDETAEIFQFNPNYRLDKGDRLNYRVTKVAHAMVMVGCDDESAERYPNASLDVQGPLWKVENSWGEKGQYIYMTDKWFDEYVYEAIVDEKYLSEKLKGYAAQKGQFMLNPWDPFARI